MRIGFTAQKREFLSYPADIQSFTPPTYSSKINSNSFIFPHYLLSEVSLAVRNKLHYHVCGGLLSVLFHLYPRPNDGIKRILKLKIVLIFCVLNIKND